MSLDISTPVIKCASTSLSAPGGSLKQTFANMEAGAKASKLSCLSKCTPGEYNVISVPKPRSIHLLQHAYTKAAIKKQVFAT